MNRKSLAAALVLIASAGSVLADDITIDNTPFTSAKSRAEVQAELQQFRSAGVNPWAQDFNPLQSFTGSKTRAQVTAEYIQSREAVAATTGEDSGAAWLAQRAPAAPAPVLAGQPVNAQ
ncbi:DUF4148 domain-containing protein [Ramlibacter montanisoli]|uniref:DUF4148 domain-containing protein n=1 Tax=Ramlibacter montanisoli TaxID=2732512 RepID=A0A849K9X2_9BURK|nr:DUF4148 domain-containing protein [Ramlibacter montanisoli]NNU45118.1 DUF4148 domain-containing protein [Ramlibacter montanisoli]